MKQPITMPALSDTMNNGRLTKWLKKSGDKLKSGEAVAEVETDKAIMEVEAFHDGYLAGPLADVNHEFPVGQTIGFIADAVTEAAESVPTAVVLPLQAAQVVPVRAAVSPQASTAPPPTRPASPASASAVPDRPQGSQLSPRARALARHGNVAPAQVVPQPAAAASKPDERAESVPVASAVPSDLAAGPTYRIERASSLREAVARSMIASATTPTFRVTAQLPLAALIGFAKEQKLSVTLLLARACANTIVKHALFNAAYTPEGLAYRDRVDIGIAVDSPEGLITPVLRDVADRTLAELAEDWRILRDKVKSRRLVPSDYRGATFYLSDLGVFPVVYSFDSIVPAGASAILSVGSSRPDGTFCTLGCDHRVVFGGDAARFLQALSEELSAPAKLIEKEKVK
jgi:pyruvate dehydrogenase E2 component (dihydrolipoamide acetyltransferase)